MSPGRALTSPLWPWGVSNALCLSCIHTAPLGRLLAGFREPMVTRIGQRPPELDAGLEVTCSFSEHLSRTCHLANPVLAVGKMGSAGCWSWISRGKVWSGSAVWPCVGRFTSLSISASVQCPSIFQDLSYSLPIPVPSLGFPTSLMVLHPHGPKR